MSLTARDVFTLATEPHDSIRREVELQGARMPDPLWEKHIWELTKGVCIYFHEDLCVGSRDGSQWEVCWDGSEENYAYVSPEVALCLLRVGGETKS